jgi:RHS repeat-associated protein
VRDVAQFSGTATTIADHLVYDSFGTITSQTNSTYQPFVTYAGMQLDTVTGLYYDNMRWYDPPNSIFVSQDPIGFNDGGTNSPMYCANSPTNATDPSGLGIKEELAARLAEQLQEQTEMEQAALRAQAAEAAARQEWLKTPEGQLFQFDQKVRDAKASLQEAARRESSEKGEDPFEKIRELSGAKPLVTPQQTLKNLLKPVGQPVGKAESGSASGGGGTVPTTTAIAHRWTANNGFMAEPKLITLQPGVRIDRFGAPTGAFASPAGLPFEARSLPPDASGRPRTTYQVMRPIENVKSGLAAPDFGQPGLGMQYQFPKPIQAYLDSGELQVVPSAGQ